MTPERFTHAQYAIERGAWMARKAVANHNASKVIVEESARLLQELRDLQPTYRITSE